jgi:hypothetical protein
VLRAAAGVVAVSDSYGPSLEESYPWFKAKEAAVLPFGAAAQDFVTARGHRPDHSLVPFGDGCTHLVYTGRCGPDMSTSLSIVFRAFKIFLAAKPTEAGRIRFHFIGTDYAPRPLGREWAMPVARSEGVEAYVSEQCYRVPYFDALYYLLNADALIAVGSNDPTYSASKVFPYILAKRPMLFVFNFMSPVIAIAEKLNCRSRYAFHSAAEIDSVARQVADEWFLGGDIHRLADVDHSAFLPYTADGMTRALAASFDRALARHAKSP